ncbi:MAG: hypothetical protein U0175_31570 [Caldilineaceae bacterium]
MKTIVRMLWLLCLSLGFSLQVAYAQAEPDSTRQTTQGGILVADPHPHPLFIPPPPLIDPGSVDASAVQALTINVNYNPTQMGRCDVPLVDWPSQARTALEYALRIWSSLLGGYQPLAVDACWTNDPKGDRDAILLAQASSTESRKNFANAPVKETFYPVTLANQLSNSDLNGAAAEIRIEFNANQPWYLGTDGRVPAGQYDLVSVALHEVGHALGFQGSMKWDDGTGDAECNGTMGVGCYNVPPFIYDRFVQNAHLQVLVDSFNNNSIELGNQLINNTLRFGGPNAMATNGNVAPRLFIPGPWQPGSSYSHLDEETFNGTTNALMTPILGFQEAIHHPGEVALGILRDLGWQIRDNSVTFVNANNTSYEDGSGLYPFNTAEEGVNAVSNGGTVIFAAGNYPGPVTIIRRMVLTSPDGTAVLGSRP